MAGGATTEEQLDQLLARAVERTAGIDPGSLDPVLPPGPVADVTAVSRGGATRDELRRLTIVFSDLVGSTPLSGRLDPETYRTVLSAYKDTCRRVIVEEFDGNLVHTRGDGMLAVFGYPTAHEDDALRAVTAALAVQRELVEVSAGLRDRVGEDLRARIGVHRGLVYLERDTEELYGLAVNLAARVQEAAEPGTVAITDEVRALVGDAITTVALPARELKGIDHAPGLHRAVEEHHRAPGGEHRWSSPLVGRERELGELRRHREAALASERPAAVRLLGDAGVGKSRLVAAFLDGLPRGDGVVELAGSPFHRHHGLHPVRELLWQRAGVGRDRAAEVQLAALRDHLDHLGLGHLLPLLAPVADIGPEGGYEPVAVEPGRLEALVADAVHQVLCAWLPAPGSTLVVDDLQWLDDATTAAVARLAGSGPAGTLVVLASREDRALGVTCETILLAPLPSERCLELVHLHDPDLGPDDADAVVRRSDGIPLFVEELVRARAGGTADTVGTAGEGTGAEGGSLVPSALYEPLSARLNALDDARLVASAAAAIGRTVHLDLLAQVSGVPTGDLDRAVTALMDGHVLERDHGDGRAVRFRHELVRLVAYELEPPSGRRRFHAVAARALAAGEVADGADWTVIADHHLRSGEPRSAAAALQRAADDARRRGSLEEARACFDRALGWLEGTPRDLEQDRLEVRLRLARAFLAVSAEGFGSEHAGLDYLRSLELCIDRPESAELYQALIATWGHWINRSDLDRAWDTSTALRPLSQGNRLHMLPTNEAGFGMIELYRGRFPEAARRLGDAVARIPEVGAEAASVPDAWTMAVDPIASMLGLHGVALAWVGDLRGAADQHEAARRRCATLPFPMGPFTDAYLLLVRSLARAHTGDVDGAATDAGAAHAIAEERGFDAWTFWASILRTTYDAAGNGPDQAAALAAQAAMSADLLHAMGARLFSAAMRSLLARSCLEAGDRAGALALGEDALGLAEETGAVMSVTETRRVLALAGPDDEAEEALLAVLERAEAEGAVISAVRVATDLVLRAARHRPLLEAAMARVVSDTAAGEPVLAAARAALSGASD